MAVGARHLVRTTLHVIVVSLGAKVLEARQGSKSSSFELGQRYPTVIVLIYGLEDGIDNELGLRLVLLLVLWTINQLVRDMRMHVPPSPSTFFASTHDAHHIWPQLPQHPRHRHYQLSGRTERYTC